MSISLNFTDQQRHQQEYENKKTIHNSEAENQMDSKINQKIDDKKSMEPKMDVDVIDSNVSNKDYNTNVEKEMEQRIQTKPVSHHSHCTRAESLGAIGMHSPEEINYHSALIFLNNRANSCDEKQQKSSHDAHVSLNNHMIGELKCSNKNNSNLKQQQQNYHLNSVGGSSLSSSESSDLCRMDSSPSSKTTSANSLNDSSFNSTFNLNYSANSSSTSTYSSNLPSNSNYSSNNSSNNSSINSPNDSSNNPSNSNPSNLNSMDNDDNSVQFCSSVSSTQSGVINQQQQLINNNNNLDNNDNCDDSLVHVSTQEKSITDQPSMDNENKNPSRRKSMPNPHLIEQYISNLISQNQAIVDNFNPWNAKKSYSPRDSKLFSHHSSSNSNSNSNNSSTEGQNIHEQKSTIKSSFISERTSVPRKRWSTTNPPHYSALAGSTLSSASSSNFCDNKTVDNNHSLNSPITMNNRQVRSPKHRASVGIPTLTSASTLASSSSQYQQHHKHHSYANLQIHQQADSQLSCREMSSNSNMSSVCQSNPSILSHSESVSCGNDLSMSKNNHRANNNANYNRKDYDFSSSSLSSPLAIDFGVKSSSASSRNNSENSIQNSKVSTPATTTSNPISMNIQDQIFNLSSQRVVKSSNLTFGSTMTAQAQRSLRVQNQKQQQIGQSNLGNDSTNDNNNNNPIHPSFLFNSTAVPVASLSANVPTNSSIYNNSSTSLSSANSSPTKTTPTNPSTPTTTNSIPVNNLFNFNSLSSSPLTLKSSNFNFQGHQQSTNYLDLFDNQNDRLCEMQDIDQAQAQARAQAIQAAQALLSASALNLRTNHPETLTPCSQTNFSNHHHSYKQNDVLIHSSGFINKNNCLDKGLNFSSIGSDGGGMYKAGNLSIPGLTDLQSLVNNFLPFNAHTNALGAFSSFISSPSAINAAAALQQKQQLTPTSSSSSLSSNINQNQLINPFCFNSNSLKNITSADLLKQSSSFSPQQNSCHTITSSCACPSSSSSSSSTSQTINNFNANNLSQQLMSADQRMRANQELEEALIREFLAKMQSDIGNSINTIKSSSSCPLSSMFNSTNLIDQSNSMGQDLSQNSRRENINLKHGIDSSHLIHCNAHNLHCHSDNPSQQQQQQQQQNTGFNFTKNLHMPSMSTGSVSPTNYSCRNCRVQFSSLDILFLHESYCCYTQNILATATNASSSFNPFSTTTATTNTSNILTTPIPTTTIASSIYLPASSSSSNTNVDEKNISFDNNNNNNNNIVNNSDNDSLNRDVNSAVRHNDSLMIDDSTQHSRSTECPMTINNDENSIASNLTKPQLQTMICCNNGSNDLIDHHKHLDNTRSPSNINIDDEKTKTSKLSKTETPPPSNEGN